jgi:hypothetical protein
MRILMFLWLAPVLNAPVLNAQVLNAQSGGDPWNGLRSKNPPVPPVILRLVTPHTFRQGELIAADLNLPNHPPVQTPPPAEHWEFAGILLDSPAGCGTVAKPCLPTDPNGGGPGGVDRSGLFSPSEHQTLALNAYLPVLRAGRYRVAALARKLVVGNRGLGSVSYGYADPPQYAVSGAVEIDIVPATADWLRQTIARSTATLSKATLHGPQARASTSYEAQRDAAQQLAFLNDPAAWTASLDLLPNNENVLLTGLARGRPAARVCDLMQARVPAPAQSVSTSYLYRLTEICARANLPPAPPIPASATFRPMAIVGHLSTTPPPATTPVAPPNPELAAWSGKWRAYTQDLLDKATAALAGSLANKQPPAKWEAFATLLQHINQVRANRPPEPDPAWIPLLTSEFVRAFPAVEAPRKQYMLDLYAAAIDSPEIVPLLESVLDSWKPGDYYEAAHTALGALHRVDPARAQARILAELAKEKTWLDVGALEMLPAGAVPPMDDALIQSLARAQRSGGWNVPLSMAAIARYATPKALPRMRAIYESQQEPCQPEMMAYFVRVDPAYAERVFRSHAWDMHTAPPPCTVQYFNRTPPLAMNSALERYIAAYLMHGDVHIKSVAAQVLGRYGTTSALPRLWETFRYFHDYWKGKGEDLAQNGEGVGLEVDLRNAIARGRGWLATEADLHLIESLCISGRCIQETRQDLEYLKAPLRIEIMTQPSVGISGRVAQYYGLESVAAMELKLAQFPRGTRFDLYAPGGHSAKTLAEILRFAAEKGLVATTL